MGLEDLEQIEKTMHLALQRRYHRYFADYPDTTALLVNRKLSEISRFLTNKGQKAVYGEGDIDFKIDFFLYLDCFLIECPRGKKFKFPLIVAVECNKPDSPEIAKEQAKDRMLKIGDLDTIRFTDSEITSSPDKCIEEIDRLLNAHYEKCREVLRKMNYYLQLRSYLNHEFDSL